MFDHRTPDEELVRSWQEGKARDEVFESLEERYARELARLFRRMGFDDETCRDLVQDTFLQAFRNLKGFRRDASLRTWLRQIARNAGLKRLRAHRTLKRAAEEVSFEETVSQGEIELPRADGETDALDRLVDEEKRRRVREIVDGLPESDRAMVLFRVWQERSVQEVAQLLKKPEGTVKSGWSRIRQSLKRKLGPQFSDLPY